MTGNHMPLLAIDLSKQSVTTVEVSAETWDRWIGGTGLGLYLLSQELRPGLQATDPDCPIFILPGPLTGTAVPSSSDCALTTLNADIPHHVCTAHAHAFFGSHLRQAGWDGIIVRGQAATPTYLCVDGADVELRSAKDLWGLDTFETVQRLRAEMGKGEEVSVACIGPAGENQVWGSSVRVDEYSGFNHGGAGVVWGAKNLKAIAIRGTGTVAVADPVRLGRVSESITAALKVKADTAPAWPFGRKQLADSLNPVDSLPEGAAGLTWIPAIAELGMVQGKNFTDTEIGVRWGRRLEKEMRKWRVESVASFNCEIACHHRSVCTTGPMAGTTLTGFAGETMEELGPNLGIEDPSIAFMLSGLVDGYGMAATSAPRIIGMLMEAFNAGEIGLTETGGLDLSWGNYQAVLELLEQTIERRGLGALIAQGMYATARELGIEHRAVHMKWGGFQDYEQRAAPLFLFQSQIVSGAGATGQMNTELSFGMGLEPDMGIGASLDPSDLSYLADVSYRSQIRKMWEDCLGMCHFAAKGLVDELELEAEALSAATGREYGKQDALTVGERVMILQRLIQLDLGFSPEEDFIIADRLLEKLDDGPAAGNGIGLAELRLARDEFYGYAGFSTATGAPSAEVLARLGLDRVMVGQG